MPTYRQCNGCKEFLPSDQVHKIQKYIKLKPADTVNYVCSECEKHLQTLGTKYIRMGG